MNKSQLENQSNQYIDNNNVICEFEKKASKLGKSGLEKLIKKINFLCLSYNPYENLDLTSEESSIIEELNLSDYLDNPFNFTNYLLQMLDIVENQLKRKIQ